MFAFFLAEIVSITGTISFHENIDFKPDKTWPLRGVNSAVISTLLAGVESVGTSVEGFHPFDVTRDAVWEVRGDQRPDPPRELQP